jgi:hypothetical protein
MRAQLETTKFQIIQWLFGVVTGAGALGLGISCRAFVSNFFSLHSIAQLNGVTIVSTNGSNPVMLKTPFLQ